MEKRKKKKRWAHLVLFDGHYKKDRGRLNVRLLVWTAVFGDKHRGRSFMPKSGLQFGNWLQTLSIENLSTIAKGTERGQQLYSFSSFSLCPFHHMSNKSWQAYPTIRLQFNALCTIQSAQFGPTKGEY